MAFQQLVPQSHIARASIGLVTLLLGVETAFWYHENQRAGGRATAVAAHATTAAAVARSGVLATTGVAPATRAVSLVAFPSSRCRFDAPRSWPVVWADLNRGGAWHSEARSPDGAVRLSCDVLQAALAAPAAAGQARRDASSAAGYRELRFAPLHADALQLWEWDYATRGEGSGRRVRAVFLPDGLSVSIDAPRDRFADAAGVLSQVLRARVTRKR